MDFENDVSNFLQGSNLFETGVDKDYLWQISRVSKQLFLEKNSSYCRSFIRVFGNIVKITPENTLVSIWDIPDLEEARTLSKYVKSCPVNNAHIQEGPNEIIFRKQKAIRDDFNCLYGSLKVINLESVQVEAARLTESQKINYCWKVAATLRRKVSRISDTRIGILLKNLSIGMPQEEAY